ncbi:flagellar motor switch protein FliN [Anoxybacillus sp. B7M1]|jgi:flagellar motor switch protein FliN|uniref:Flagellar motor switch phosphatase FliY n=1 Tax=Anoxybacteroides rupiense TaxID=311460 RepID=A0ABD5IQE4_9BACL|nr:MULTISPECIES: flagellar motor switch phosphatase FliY [Anoxybacillus]ANB57210.1 flagellar motor switch protein FliN [Anoxybacillus sp. B2M1]ANB62618.1 flagellar motor switch protein FliN [Anoxybacillus sp. B7M1]KXG10558.1 Flagellar motor switch protein FliN [Anoxybacillus sp. P3H1B]MED5050487.1 flagellar motor switch phosphatase FliY [Anoxybacillus rupiensis]OQM46834.1 flagellar motor switch phosphatase FliY [Anoxybacillus sp. UARK-01]
MMSDDMLSQDEIDALLRGADGANDSPTIDEVLSTMEQDALGEIGNISFGSSATALSVLLNQKVEITTPNVSIIHREDVENEFPHPYVAIQVNYTEGFLGTNLLVIKQSDAAIIADLMLGGNGQNPMDLLGEIQLSAVQEAMNQMMGSAATSMSTIFGKKVDISPPSLHLLDIKEGEGLEYLPPESVLVKVSFRLKIGTLIDSNIMQLLPIDFAKELVQNLLQMSSSSESVSDKIETKTAPASSVVSPSAAGSSQLPGSAYDQPAASAQPEIAQPYPHAAQPAAYAPNHFGTYASAGQRQVQPADFASFEPAPLAEAEARNLNMLLDIPLQVTVELGRTKRSVQDILNLSSGSIIELDKLAGEPVDILVNNKLIAKGEVVVIDENFGVRVTDIISQSDRLKNLR